MVESQSQESSSALAPSKARMVYITNVLASLAYATLLILTIVLAINDDDIGIDFSVPVTHMSLATVNCTSATASAATPTPTPNTSANGRRSATVHGLDATTVMCRGDVSASHNLLSYMDFANSSSMYVIIMIIVMHIVSILWHSGNTFCWRSMYMDDLGLNDAHVPMVRVSQFFGWLEQSISLVIMLVLTSYFVGFTDVYSLVFIALLAYVTISCSCKTDATPSSTGPHDNTYLWEYTRVNSISYQVLFVVQALLFSMFVAGDTDDVTPSYSLPLIILSAIFSFGLLVTRTMRVRYWIFRDAWKGEIMEIILNIVLKTIFTLMLLLSVIPWRP